MKKLIAVLVLCISAAMLASCGGGDSSTKAKVPENPGNVYRVITCDESGAPVEGVAIQFCSDQMCQMGETDADGIATFNSEEGVYTAHVYMVPEGYADDETEYKVPEKHGDVYITLKAAK